MNDEQKMKLKILVETTLPTSYIFYLANGSVGVKFNGNHDANELKELQQHAVELVKTFLVTNKIKTRRN